MPRIFPPPNYNQISLDYYNKLNDKISFNRRDKKIYESALGSIKKLPKDHPVLAEIYRIVPHTTKKLSESQKDELISLFERNKNLWALSANIRSVLDVLLPILKAPKNIFYQELAVTYEIDSCKKLSEAEKRELWFQKEDLKRFRMETLQERAEVVQKNYGNATAQEVLDVIHEHSSKRYLRPLCELFLDKVLSMSFKEMAIIVQKIADPRLKEVAMSEYYRKYYK